MVTAYTGTCSRAQEVQWGVLSESCDGQNFSFQYATVLNSIMLFSFTPICTHRSAQHGRFS